MKTKVLSLLYFLTGILFILLENSSSPQIRFILKALIIPWLIIILAINLKPFFSKLNILIAAGLLFSWTGDMVLQFSFVPGLISFLIAHIMFLTAFFLTPGRNSILTNRSYLLAPVAIYGAGLGLYLFDDLGAMTIPVFIYAAVILVMLTAALNRFGKVNRCSYRLVLAGAILFVVSDSAIAVSKFSWDFNYSGWIIMSTYITAQYLITAGYIKQYRDSTA